MSQVYWAVLMERTIPDYAFAAFMDMSMRAGNKGYARINVGYTRIDVARNRVAQTFVESTDDPDDVLIMLDMDHIHSRDTLDRLAAHGQDVVAALAFRRCPPYDPQMYKLVNDALVQPSTWEPGLLEVDAFGMAAFAVRRRVFDALEERGVHYPWFRFWYPNVPMAQQSFPSEDIFFCMCLGAAGIPMYVDTTLVAPHLTVSTVADDTWAAYLEDNPGLRLDARPVPAGLAEKLGVKA